MQVADDHLLRHCWATGNAPMQVSSWKYGQHCVRRPTTDIGLRDECRDEIVGATVGAR